MNILLGKTLNFCNIEPRVASIGETTVRLYHTCEINSDQKISTKEIRSHSDLYLLLESRKFGAESRNLLPDCDCDRLRVYPHPNCPLASRASESSSKADRRPYARIKIGSAFLAFRD